MKKIILGISVLVLLIGVPSISYAKSAVLMCKDNGNGTRNVWWQYTTGWWIFSHTTNGPVDVQNGTCEQAGV